jgi:hypothetical protein
MKRENCENAIYFHVENRHVIGLKLKYIHRVEKFALLPKRGKKI